MECLTASEYFAAYEHINSGFLAFTPDHRSTVFYCNRRFAQFLGTHPSRLIGRSLDELSKANFLHSTLSNRMRKDVVITTRAMAGGRIVEGIHQRHPERLKTVLLNVYRIERITVTHEVFLAGYIRKATLLESWIYKAKLDSDLDKLWKPIAAFFLAGKWRPVFTFLSPFLINWVSSNWPDIADAFRGLITLLSGS